jgi:hypothetical protein
MAQFLEVPEHERFHLKKSKGWNRIPKEVARQRQIDVELESQSMELEQRKAVEELPRNEADASKPMPKRSKRQRMAAVKARAIADLEEALEPTTKEAAATKRSGCGCCCVAGWLFRPIIFLASFLGFIGLLLIGFVVFILVEVSQADGSN